MARAPGSSSEPVANSRSVTAPAVGAQTVNAVPSAVRRAPSSPSYAGNVEIGLTVERW